MRSGKKKAELIDEIKTEQIQHYGLHFAERLIIKFFLLV